MLKARPKKLVFILWLYIFISVDNWIPYDVVHHFSVWLRTGSNPLYINRFRSDTGIVIYCIFVILIMLKWAFQISMWSHSSYFKRKYINSSVIFLYLLIHYRLKYDNKVLKIMIYVHLNLLMKTLTAATSAS